MLASSEDTDWDTFWNDNIQRLMDRGYRLCPPDCAGCKGVVAFSQSGESGEMDTLAGAEYSHGRVSQLLRFRTIYILY